MRLLAALPLVILTACVSGDGDDRADSSSGSGCLRAASSRMSDIERGLENGLSLGSGHSVRSDDYEQVWMIAADIDGPDMRGNDDIGVWATNSLSSGSGLIYAVDGMAREFSDWGDFGSVTDHGVQQSRDCFQST